MRFLRKLAKAGAGSQGTTAATVSVVTGTPPKETTMSTKNETASRIFHSSRRRASGLLVGVLLVVGYFGSAAILIRDYSSATVVTDHNG